MVGVLVCRSGSVQVYRNGACRTGNVIMEYLYNGHTFLTLGSEVGHHLASPSV